MEVNGTAPPEGNKLVDRDKTQDFSADSISNKRSDSGANGTSILDGKPINATPPTPTQNSQLSPESQLNMTELTHVTSKTLISSSGRYTLNENSTEPDFILIYDFISDKDCISIYNDVMASGTLKQHYNTINGQKKKQLRYSAWFGPIPYNFSGNTMATNNPNDIPAITSTYDNILAIDKNICDYKNKPNSYLINFYRNGNDVIGEHKDNESSMNKEFPITSLSIGETRHLHVRSKKGGPIICTIKLISGCLLIMKSGFQNYFHNIPRDNTRKPRMNITYRDSIVLKPCLHITPSKPPPSIPTPAISNEKENSPTSGKFWVKEPPLEQTEAKTPPKSHPNDTPTRLIRSSLLKNNTTTPSSTSSKSTRPLSSLISLDTLLACVDFMKKGALQKECLANNLSTKGKCAVIRHRLHTYIKQAFRSAQSTTTTPPPQSSTIPPPPSLADSVHISNCIQTLQSSILDLSSELKSQQKLLESIIMDKAPRQNSTKQQHPSHEQFQAFDRRIESIEDSLANLKDQFFTSNNDLVTTKSNTFKLLSATKETLQYIKTPSTSTITYQPSDTIPLNLPPELPLNLPDTLPPPPPELLLPPNFPQPPSLGHFPPLPPVHSHNSNVNQLPPSLNHNTNHSVNYKNTAPVHQLQQKNLSRQNQHPQKVPNDSQKKHRTVIICDSQLKGFNTNHFMNSFNTELVPIYTFESFLAGGHRRVLQRPKVDCYVVQLGVNDLKKCSSGFSNSYHRVIKMAEETVLKLLASSSTAKVCVSFPTPTPRNTQLNNIISKFNEDMNNWITGRRNTNLSDCRRRLFTINNSNFSNCKSDGRPCPYNADMLHLNNYGLKKLAINMKFGVYRAFGWKYTYTPKPDDSSNS